MRDLRYPYKPGFLPMLFVILFFGGVGYFMVFVARNNTRGLIIEHAIELSPDQATIFDWCLAALFGLLALAGILGLVASFTSRKELILTETTLTAPGSMWSRHPKIVRVSDITQLETRRMKRHRFLDVYYPGGKAVISASLLPNGATFDELRAELANRTQRA
ncbi:MAG: hypothetical protein WCD20_01985 [Rhodomicrobium sp.]